MKPFSFSLHFNLEGKTMNHLFAFIAYAAFAVLFAMSLLGVSL